MYPLVTLLMAAAATGADPQPVVSETVTPVASYTYTEGEPESRPGFLDRIRNAFGSHSSSAPSATYSSRTYQVSGPSVSPVPLAPAVISTEPAGPRFVPSGSSAEPPLADTVPVTTPAPAADVRPVAPPQPIVTQPAYTYPAPAVNGTLEPNGRVRFPRIRKLFGGSQSSSPSSQALPEDVNMTPQVVAPAAPAPAAPVIQGQPQRMPVGNP